MSDPIDDDEIEAVGYGRPPKSSQFRPGQSGNPRGRPRKKESPPERLPELFPTREAVRLEARRLIAIKDAAGRHEVTGIEAVVRAQYVKAMQGSVFAQREILNRQLAEDERRYQERKANFNFWHDYQTDARSRMEAARRAGKIEPDPLPHPDDIDLDWETLGVRFRGPVDEQALADTNCVLELRRLALMMSQYLGEEISRPARKGDDYMIGQYFGVFALASACLPPRLRPLIDTDHISLVKLMEERSSGGMELRQRCEAIGLPFLSWKPRMEQSQVSVSALGVEWPECMTTIQTPEKKRARRPTV